MTQTHGAQNTRAPRQAAAYDYTLAHPVASPFTVTKYPTPPAHRPPWQGGLESASALSAEGVLCSAHFFPLSMQLRTPSHRKMLPQIRQVSPHSNLSGYSLTEAPQVGD